jgi:ribonucleoside-triphosphate reductase
MQIAPTICTQPLYQSRLRESFLAPYYMKRDPFGSLLARSTYLTKYCRNGEVWTDTIRRVVEGNTALGNVSVQEQEMLFHLFWTGQCLPPGRGLWTGGVDGIPSDARFNCWYTTLRGVDDWCWTMNQLMLGGGVGVGLSGIDRLPGVVNNNSRLAMWCGPSHPNRDEVAPNDKSFLNGQTPVFKVQDSRTGWVDALRQVLTVAFEGRDLIVDVNEIRPRGEPLKVFGGIACGPGPLVTMLRSVWEIVREAKGRRLTSVECLDVTTLIGCCVKSGNVRRSAIIVLGEADDQPFRDAKKDAGQVKSHRHTSNNSIVFRSEAQMADFDWGHLVEDNIAWGEPGILNLPLIWKTDPGAVGVNPCGEVPLSDRESCNLAEVFPAKFDSNVDPDTAFRLVARYCLRQRLTTLSDLEANEIQMKNMKIGVGLGGLCDFNWNPELLSSWYKIVRSESNAYADELGVNRPITVSTVKPSGTISLLNGSSPGMHAPFAPYYLRRTRLADNDPMVPALQEAGVPWEHDVYDKTGHTLVFGFPMKAIHDRISQQTQTLVEQFERQAMVQQCWADNSVSATLSFNAETEKTEMARLLRDFAPRFKSTSMLSKSHSYDQPPYEEIDEYEFRHRSSQINFDHPLVEGGEMHGLDDCHSGICPIR